MADRFATTTISFLHSFDLPGASSPLPAGEYRIEWRLEDAESAPLPTAPLTPVVIHLPARAAVSAGAETLTVPWAELSRAIAREKACAAKVEGNLVDSLLEDPLIRLVMSSDHVSDFELRRNLRAARMRRMGRVALAGKGRRVPVHLAREATRAPDARTGLRPHDG